MLLVHKTLGLLLLVVSLIGCGSGDNEKKIPKGAAGSNESPFEALDTRARKFREGRDAPALMTNESVGWAVGAVLGGPLQYEPVGERYSATYDETGLGALRELGPLRTFIDRTVASRHRRMPWAELETYAERVITGGEASVTYSIVEANTTGAPRYMQVVYDNWWRNGVMFNGTVLIEEPMVSSELPMRIGLNELEVIQGDTTHQLTGTINWSGGGTCGVGEKRTATILSTDVASGSSFLVDNFETYATSPSDDWTCGDKAIPNTWHGDIVLDGHGLVSVATPIAVSHTWKGFSREGSLHDPIDSAGVIELRGAIEPERSIARIRISGKVDWFSSIYEFHTATIEILQGQNVQQSFQARATDFFRGALSQLYDADLDGIPDGWEMWHGLNPADPADALLDPDADGISNLDEYIGLGDPTQQADTEAAFIAVHQPSPEPPDPIALEISVPTVLSGNSENLRSVDAKIRRPMFALTEDVEITVHASDGLRLESAELISDGLQPFLSRCTIDVRVRCTMPELTSTDTLTLTLAYRLLTESDHQLSWSVSSLEPETNNTQSAWVTSDVRFINSMTEIQAEIDRANSGDTIQLPAGRYEGTLDGRGKTLEVQGASGEFRTVLISSDVTRAILSNTGSRSTWSGIDWRTTGAPLADSFGENLTLAFGSIAPLAGANHDINGFFGYARDKSHRLRSMSVSGFGVGDGNQCSSLIRALPSASYWTETTIQGSVFTDNDCAALVEKTAQSLVLLSADNNTFINNTRLFSFSGDSRTHSRVSLRNNIVIDSDEVLSVSAGLFESGFLVSARNIILRSDRESMLDNDLLTRSGVSIEATDLAVEPQFVDAQAGDYRLSSDSPAIDAGVPPQPYIWTYDDIAYENLQPDLSDVKTPLDGNGDGIGRCCQR